MKWFKRKAKEEFPCPKCGKSHAGMPTDYGSSLPDVVWALGAEARKQHLDWSTDVCHFEDRWFLRGVLEVPFQFQPDRFGWGLWVEVSEETIGRYHAIFQSDGSHCPREKGFIANNLKMYPPCLGLPVEVQFGPADKRPLIFMTEGDHSLAVTQRNGLTIEQYHDILAVIAP